MAFTHTITYKIVEGSNQIEKSIAISAGQKVSISEAIADGTTDGVSIRAPAGGATWSLDVDIDLELMFQSALPRGERQASTQV